MAKNSVKYLLIHLIIATSIIFTNCNDLNCSKYQPITSYCERKIINSTDVFSVNFSNISEVNSTSDVFNIWQEFPKSFVPALSSNIQCAKESRMYLESLQRLEMWALKMYDSSAKLPSGILSGNINQLGSFDQCLSIDDNVHGKYCLASIDVVLPNHQGMDELDDLLHGRYYLRSNLTDFGHRVPRFSSILWGVCVPSSCSGYDIEREMTSKLSYLHAKVKVSESMCTVKHQKEKASFGKSIALAFFMSLAILIFLGTVLDDGAKNGSPFEIMLNCFSLRRNAPKLFNISGDDELKGVEGVRALNILALLMCHKSMAMVYNPFINRVQMSEIFGMPWAVIGRTAIVFTDSFLFLSGMLNSYNLFNDLKKHGTIDFRGRILARWFRLFPLLLGLILFCTYVLPDINSGPQWNLVVKEHSEICKDNMWKSFLFIHNFFGFETMCLTHTHQIGIDMQLYLLTPALVTLLWKKPKLGIFVSCVIGVLSTMLRYYTVLKYNISMVVYYGISVQQLLNAAKFSYILPTHRATIYLMGVLMAYFLMTDRSKFKLSKPVSASLWFVSVVPWLWAWLGPWRMGLKGYQYTSGPAAQYAAFAPIGWGVFLAYAHWAINTGHGFFMTRIFSFRIYKFFNKIGYAIYLVQFPIYFYNVGITRYSDYYKPLNLLYLPEVFSIIAVSTIATLAIEMPFNNIHREFFSKSKGKLHQK